MCPGVGLDRGLNGLPTLLMVLGAGGMCSTLLLLPTTAPSVLVLSLSEVADGFRVFLCLVVHNLPQLQMHAVIFSPL